MSNSIDMKSQFSFIYDLLFSILALVADYLALCDLTTGCTDFQLKLDNAITVIFIIDYVVRVIVAKNKRLFFKQNIFDLIAIVPFNSLLRYSVFSNFLKY